MKFGFLTMLGLNLDYPLVLSTIIEHAAATFGNTALVSHGRAEATRSNEQLAPRLDTVDRFAVMTSRNAMPATSLPNVVCYEELIEAGDPSFTWPELSERSACMLCFTSGTTGQPNMPRLCRETSHPIAAQVVASWGSGYDKRYDRDQQAGGQSCAGRTFEFSRPPLFGKRCKARI